MNANLSQPQPGEWEERAHLLPPVERELPAGRHQFHRNRLMAVIRDDLRDRRTTGAAPARTTRRPGPRLRRAILLPVAVCVLAGTVVAGVRILSDQGGTVPAVATGPVLTTRIGAANPAGAAQLLDRISLAAAEVSGPAVRKDQYIYIGVQQANTYVRTDRGKNTLVSQEPHLRQTWNSPDGAKGWLIEPGNTGPGGLTLDRATKSGKPPQPYLNAPTHDYLATLPTDPDVLLQKIYTETEGMGRTPTRRPSPRSATCCVRATRRPPSRPRSTRPPRRSPVWSRWTRRSTPRAATGSRSPTWTRPPGSARNGSSTRTVWCSSANARSRSAAAPARGPDQARHGRVHQRRPDPCGRRPDQGDSGRIPLTGSVPASQPERSCQAWRVRPLSNRWAVPVTGSVNSRTRARSCSGLR